MDINNFKFDFDKAFANIIVEVSDLSSSKMAEIQHQSKEKEISQSQAEGSIIAILHNDALLISKKLLEEYHKSLMLFLQSK